MTLRTSMGNVNIEAPRDRNGEKINASRYLECAEAFWYMVNEHHITSNGIKNGEVDGSDVLTPNDALIIQRFTLHLIDTL